MTENLLADLAEPASLSVSNSPDVSAYTYPFPGVVRFELSSSCNLACAHCPTGTVAMERGIMADDVIRKVVDIVKRNISSIRVVVLYHGGEPLLNRNFFRVCRELKDIGVPFIKTVSNGMLLNRQRIASLVECGLDSIEFSLDAESAEQNNHVRRNGKFENVLKNIRDLVARKEEVGSLKPEIHISTTQFVKPDVYTPDQEAAPPDYLLETFKDYLGKSIKSIKSTFALKWPEMRVDPAYFDELEDPYDNNSNNQCDHVVSTITIRWNGDIVPCCYDLTSKAVMGNIFDQEIEVLWNNAAFQELRRSIEQKNFNDLCNGCAVVKKKVFLLPKFN